MEDQCFEHGGANSRFIPCVTESRMQHNKYVERKGYCLSYPVLFQSLCLLLRRSPLKTCKKKKITVLALGLQWLTSVIL